jgi:glycosyltransferase 2 family protein
MSEFKTLKRIYHFLGRHAGAARLALVAVMFGVLFSNIHPGDILATIKKADPRYLGIGVLLVIPNLFMQFMKWRFVLRVLNPRPSARLAINSLFGGFFLGAATPSRTGELGRGFLMPGYSKLRIASLTIVDKGFSQLSIFLTGLQILGFYLPFPFWMIPPVILIIVVILLFNIHRLRPRIERFLGRFTHSGMVDNALGAFDALSHRTIIGMICYSVVFYFIFTMQFLFVLKSYAAVPLSTGIHAIPLIYFANTVLPISIGEFGMKDFAAVQILSRFGIPGAAVLSATFTQNMLAFILPSLIGGVIFSLTKHPPIREVRALDVEKALRSESECPSNGS